MSLIRYSIFSFPDTAFRLSSIISYFAVLSILLFARFPTCAAASAAPKSEPLNVTAAVTEAQKLTSKGQPAQALKVLDELGEKAKGWYRVSLARCIALTVLGRYEEALAQAEQAADLNPNDTMVQYSRAVPLMQLNRDTQAIPILEGILKTEPRFAPALFYLAIARDRQGRADIAKDYFRQAYMYATPAEEWLKPYVKNYLSQSKAPVAEPGPTSQPAPQSIYQPIYQPASQPPDTGELKTIKTHRNHTIVSPVGATPSLTPSINDKNTVISPPPMRKLGHVNPAADDDYPARLAQLYQTGDLDKAADLARSQIQAAPSDPTPNLDLAAILEQQGKPASALEYYARAAALDPQNAETLTSWGRCLELAGRTNDGILKYKEAIQTNPKLAAAYINLGNAYLDLKQYDDAESTFKAALEIDPSYMLLYYGLLATYVFKGDAAAAADILKQHFGARDINPGALPQTDNPRYTLITLVLSDPTATFNLARMLADYGRPDDAATFFHLFVQTWPGRFPDAEQTARRFLQQHPAPTTK